MSMKVIRKDDLDFLDEAIEMFKANPELSTWTNAEETHIALRFNGYNVRDSIRIHKISPVAEFERVLPQAPVLVLDNA